MKNVKYIPGDLVIHYGAISMIDAVNCNQAHLRETYQLHHLDDNTSYDEVEKHYLKPITLTPAILEANGWNLSIIKDRNYWSKVSSDEELTRFKFLDASIQRIAVKDKIVLIYFSSNPNTFFFELSYKTIRIRYIHELQHLLFGLSLELEVLAYFS